MLKLVFDAHQEYQEKAIQSVLDLFTGAERGVSHFSFISSSRELSGTVTDLGYANRLDLIPDDIYKNTLKVQDKNSLDRSSKLFDNTYDIPNFSIEMETGTGKTYVYTRSILELNARYGFSKFIIVVPSIAIKEGVKKSLDITRDHFKALYPQSSYNAFSYSSSNLQSVKQFATSNNIEIMIINIASFNKDTNIINQEYDKFDDRKPLEFIRDTRPVVIIDEPQSVDNTEKSQNSIKSLNPLFILRYSATHRETYNLIYRLGPIEAYNTGLVKGIEVLSISGDGRKEAPVELISTSAKNGFSAKLKINVLNSKTAAKETKTVTVNNHKRNSLFTLSQENSEYKNLFISDICTQTDNEFIVINEKDVIRKGVQQKEDLDSVRVQINATIETHLKKEAVLLKQGIKVLSLIFIDEVKKYRSEDASNGEYIKLFQEEYLKLINKPALRELFTEHNNYEKQLKAFALMDDTDKVHRGYFSQDKKGFKDTKGDTKDDESTYDLIMKNKEKLLTIDPNDKDAHVRFIFSHSALKEGWDNPNVFQICTLISNKNTLTKRQKIGRGLRLAVNQAGERIKDRNVNVLTVVANESYEDFAKTLQKELEEDTNTKFGVIENRLFEHLALNLNGESHSLSYSDSLKIVSFFKEKKLIDKNGKPNPEFKQAIANKIIELPDEFKAYAELIIDRIETTQKSLPIANANERVYVKLNRQIYLNEDFKDLWDKIKYKTVYRFNFDEEKFLNNCKEAIKNMPEIKETPIIARWVDLQIEQKGISHNDPKLTREFYVSEYHQGNLPDLISEIEAATRLKKSSIIDLLIESNRLDEFKINPNEFIQQIVKALNDVKRGIVNNANGIKYERIGNEYWSQKLFEEDDEKNIIAYLNKNAIEARSENCLHNYVKYDSGIESKFAKSLMNDEEIKLFAKIPDWFKINTPVGTYNPDWLILLNYNSEEKLYFIVETKGKLDNLDLDLKGLERAKIACAKEHFKALNTGISFNTADDYNEWRKKCRP